MLNKFIEALEDIATVEKQPKLEGEICLRFYQKSIK